MATTQILVGRSLSDSHLRITLPPPRLFFSMTDHPSPSGGAGDKAPVQRQRIAIDDLLNRPGDNDPRKLNQLRSEGSTSSLPSSPTSVQLPSASRSPAIEGFWHHRSRELGRDLGDVPLPPPAIGTSHEHSDTAISPTSSAGFPAESSDRLHRLHRPLRRRTQSLLSDPGFGRARPNRDFLPTSVPYPWSNPPHSAAMASGARTMSYDSDDAMQLESAPSDSFATSPNESQNISPEPLSDVGTAVAGLQAEPQPRVQQRQRARSDITRTSRASRSRSFRPSYTEEELDFIWFMREDVGLSWREISRRFSATFPGDRRLIGGLQCRYYRILSSHNILQPRERPPHIPASAPATSTSHTVSTSTSASSLSSSAAGAQKVFPPFLPPQISPPSQGPLQQSLPTEAGSSQALSVSTASAALARTPLAAPQATSPPQQLALFNSPFGMWRNKRKVYSWMRPFAHHLPDFPTAPPRDPPPHEE